MVQPSITGIDPVTTTTAWPPTPDYCASRLPCGVCLILDRMCPKMATYQVEPTWYQSGPTCVNEVSK